MPSHREITRLQQRNAAAKCYSKKLTICALASASRPTQPALSRLPFAPPFFTCPGSSPPVSPAVHRTGCQASPFPSAKQVQAGVQGLLIFGRHPPSQAGGREQPCAPKSSAEAHCSASAACFCTLHKCSMNGPSAAGGAGTAAERALVTSWNESSDIVIQCGKCARILGDSHQFVCIEDTMQLFTLSGMGSHLLLAFRSPPGPNLFNIIMSGCCCVARTYHALQLAFAGRPMSPCCTKFRCQQHRNGQGAANFKRRNRPWMVRKPLPLGSLYLFVSCNIL